MSRKVPAILFFIVSALVCIPVLLHPYLPLVDIPNHIARLYIAANSGTALDAYYEYSLHFQTNIAADLVWALGANRIWAPEVFSNLTFAFYAVSFLAAFMTLAKVVNGRWSIWPLTVNLVVFNAAYFWGFQNFLVTVPLAIFALAAWLSMEKTAVLTRVLVFILICMLLYLMHVFGLIVFLVAAFGRELQRVILAGKDWPIVFRNNFALAIPFSIPIAIAFYGWFAGPENLFGGGSSFGSISQRLQSLVSPVYSDTSDASPWFNTTGYVTLVFLTIIFLTSRKKTGPRLVFSHKMIGPVVALAVLAAFTPAVLNGVALTHIRFPFILIALFIASTSWVDLSVRQATLLCALIALISLARLGMIERLTAYHSRQMEQLVTVLEYAPAGSRVLPIRNSTDGPTNRFWHAQAYAVPTANAFVPTLFLGAHTVSLKEEWWDSAVAQGFSVPWQFLTQDLPLVDNPNPLLSHRFIIDWQDKFTHILQLNKLPENSLAGLPLTLVFRNGDFALYEIAN